MIRLFLSLNISRAAALAAVEPCFGAKYRFILGSFDMGMVWFGSYDWQIWCAIWSILIKKPPVHPWIIDIYLLFTFGNTNTTGRSCRWGRTFWLRGFRSSSLGHVTLGNRRSIFSTNCTNMFKGTRKMVSSIRAHAIPNPIWSNGHTGWKSQSGLR